MAKKEHTRTTIEISRVLKALAWGALGYVIVSIVVGIVAATMQYYYTSTAIVENQPAGDIRTYEPDDGTLKRIVESLDLTIRWQVSHDEAISNILKTIHFEEAENGNTAVVCRHVNVEDAKDIAEAWCDLSPNFKTRPSPELIVPLLELLKQYDEKQHELNAAQTAWNYLPYDFDRSAEHPEAKKQILKLMQEVGELRGKIKRANASDHLGQTVLKEPERSMIPETDYPVLEIGKYLGFAIFALIVALKIIRLKPVDEDDIAAAEEKQTERGFDF